MRYPQSLHNLEPNSARTVSTDKPSLTMNFQSAEPIEKTYWVSAILVSVYFLSLFDSPLVIVSDLRWYSFLGLSIMAFLFQKKTFSLKGTKILFTFWGLGFLGAVLSLFRAPDLNQALRNTVGAGLGFVSFLFLIPVFSNQFVRRIVLVGIIVSAFIWCFQIALLQTEYERLAYSTFAKTGSNKNNIGFFLSLASTALFYLALFWKPFKVSGKLPMLLFRLALTSAGIFMIYSIMSIYARSSIGSAFVGALAVLSIMLIKNKGIATWLGAVLLVAIFYFLFSNFIFPQILIVSPQWLYILDSFQDSGFESFPLRLALLEKGWFLISQNPVIGVGIGQSKGSFGYFPSYYIANLYLTDWAEKGILGILSYIVFILAYVKIFLQNFFDLPIFDQIWLLLFIPLFFSLLFIDMTSVVTVMAVILAGIKYDENCSMPSKELKSRGRW